ncbi:Macrolide export ATP-binding/permease protein MacB [Micrococcus luteus NCTC 2665]|uniref:ABC-type antimicrobial peptide transport system, ATPase component n=3 Tax=Micrococcus luteus TaxID=1270 RepID=C5C7H3_MICLC|nr:ABC transporter ATP-binding protein [Micrococcus luteus]ACS31661.1 ABC-type antimicrobial peptide transport system, ATPase component [Micrococcus luteus NCTC 2665]AJO56711.1 peptide ABC transporter ATP-binding protein [Micrococcus luteus]QCY44532.1 ABC transporter ATP-binding protein [Micrococcus luteus]RFP69831.1 ABC transporter ATP-binding protein [Micrococcus luteus]SQG48092.1 Macrolide export ATP-binding/permease protein MacB [Micrococcus luteus NCTC 2665]
MDTPPTSHPASPTTPGPVTPGPGTPSSSATTTTAPAVCARGLTRAYGRGDAQVHALRGVDVDFASGAFAAIMGPSGSGKSTLMHCLAGLDAPTSGSVRIGGTEITGLDDTALTRLRRDRVGFVFQAFNLVPTLTAEQNIVLPLELAGRAPDRAWLDEITRTLGLADRLGHRPHELSGGQQQRVAVARALLTRPDVVFGDEPTGNLDTATSAEVLGLLRRSAREMGQTVIMVTHDPVAASAADRVVLLADGRLAGELVDPTVESVTAALTALSAPAEGGVR